MIVFWASPLFRIADSAATALYAAVTLEPKPELHSTRLIQFGSTPKSFSLPAATHLLLQPGGEMEGGRQPSRRFAI